MGSSGKKKTTMAKLTRERKLRERRLDKQAKKDARKNAPPDDGLSIEAPPEEDTYLAGDTPTGVVPEPAEPDPAEAESAEAQDARRPAVQALADA